MLDPSVTAEHLLQLPSHQDQQENQLVVVPARKLRPNTKENYELVSRGYIAKDWEYSAIILPKSLSSEGGKIFKKCLAIQLPTSLFPDRLLMIACIPSTYRSRLSYEIHLAKGIDVISGACTRQMFLIILDRHWQW